MVPESRSKNIYDPATLREHDREFGTTMARTQTLSLSPVLEKDRKRILDEWRRHNQPHRGDTSPFWEWYESEYPGATGLLDERMAAPDSKDIVDLGFEVKSREVELLKGVTTTSEADVLAARGSKFGVELHEIGDEFIRLGEQDRLPPGYEELWAGWQARTVGNPDADLESELVPAAWSRSGGRLSEHPPEDAYAIDDSFRRGQRARNDKGRITKATNDVIMDDEELKQQGRDTADLWGDDLDAGFEANQELADFNLVDDSFQPMRDSSFGSEHTPDSRLLVDSVGGRAFIDVAALLEMDIARRRIYPTAWQPHGRERLGREFWTYRQKTRPWTDGCSVVPPAPMRCMRTSRATCSGSRSTPGTGSRSSPSRGMSRSSSLTPSWASKPGIPGDMEFFEVRQAQIRDRVTRLVFDRMHHTAAALEVAMPRFINKVSVLLGKLTSQTPGEKLAAMEGINVSAAQTAWDNFLVSRDYQYLEDVHLRAALGLGFSIESELGPAHRR